MFEVTVLFKSGNTLKLKVKTFKVSKSGQHVEQVVYEMAKGQVLHIDVTQIEAVTSKELTLFERLGLA